MADFEQYKQSLLKFRERLIHSVGALEEAIREDVSTPGDISSVPTHPADNDAEGVENHIALAENEQGLLEQVEEALSRLEQGTYGHCQSCGCEIPEARLEALPYTAQCVNCAAATQAASG